MAYDCSCPPRPAAPRRTTGVRVETDRAVELAHHGRPQAHRHPLPLHRARVLPDRRPRGAAHPHPARGPEQHLVSAEMYNQLFTMHGTTMIFLAIMPLSRRVLQLHDPAADRRARRGLPAAERLQLLGVPVRRAVPQRRASCSARRPNGGWFGYANLTTRQYSPGLNIDFWMLGLQILGIVVAGGGVQLLRHHRQHARAGHDADAHADVHLDGVHHAVPAAAGVPGHHGRADPAACSTASSARNFYDAAGRRRSAALAAPVLDLRAPRGLHPDPAGVRASSPRSCRSSRASRCSATR